MYQHRNLQWKKMAERARKPHAIMFSLPYQGHITPFVSLAIKLASNGCTVTFVHTEYAHQMLAKAGQLTGSEVDFFADARNSGLDIRYKTISDGFETDFDRILNAHEYWESLLRDFPARVDEMVGGIISESDPALDPFLVADTIYSWPVAIAKKYNLVNVSFWTEPALVFSLSYHMDLQREKGHFPCPDNIDEEIDYIPGVQSINTRDLMPYLKESHKTSIVHKIAVKAFEQVKKADFILCNTVNELESNTLSALNQKQPIYAIGPVNFSSDPTRTISVSKTLWSESDCTKWLDSKAPGSVLYVSFGSLAKTNKKVIEEIAHGVILSEVNFIWSVRTNILASGDNDVFPIAFHDRVKDRGLIIPWCDQNLVLSHPSVGGFLTHCGWNSILESIWHRVPMICFPLLHDQPTNRKLVVDDWKIGINICDGKLTVDDWRVGDSLSNGLSITKNEVAQKIKRLIDQKTSNVLRQEIKRVRAILQDALSSDGSSQRNFHQFVSDLKDKIVKNRKFGSQENRIAS